MKGGLQGVFCTVLHTSATSALTAYTTNNIQPKRQGCVLYYPRKLLATPALPPCNP